MIGYDSAGLSTGLAVGDVFSVLGMRMIANRKAVFESAIRETDFRASALSQFDRYMLTNAEAANTALRDAKTLAEQELARSYTVGVGTTDRAVTTYRRQGFQTDKPEKIKNAALLTVATATVSALAQAAAYAQESARRQYLQIVNLVGSDSGENARQKIDTAQAIFLKKGIGGVVDRDGYERELSGQTELLIRDASHQTLIRSEAERASQYGLYYVLVSAHPSSCPLCAPWQDMVLIDDVNNSGKADGKTEVLSTAQRAGLGHPHCRHNWIPFVPGLDDPHLFAHEEDTPERTALKYAVEQTQRYNERMIQEWKRREAGSMTDYARWNAENKVKEWQAKQRALRDYANERDVPFYRQYSREQIKPVEPNIPTPESNLTPGWYGLHYPSAAERDIGGNKKIPISKAETYNVSRTVYTKAYNDAYKDVGLGKNATDSLASGATEILRHRDGTNGEDLYLIDRRTGEVAAKNTESEYASRVDTTPEMLRMMNDDSGRQYVVLHNHPAGLPPSIGDLNALQQRKNVELGVIAGNDGSIIIYTKPESPIDLKKYELLLTKYRVTRYNYSEFTAQLKTLQELQKEYGFSITVVKGG